MAQDGERGYWTVFNSGVRSVLKQGGGEELVLDGLDHPDLVAVNAEYVYVSSFGTFRDCPDADCTTTGFGIDRTRK
jgi:hypothetical protein